MAGKFKPVDVKNEEARYKLISYSTYNGSSNNPKGNSEIGIFNESEKGYWNDGSCLYFSKPTHYVEVEIEDNCNIWRYPDGVYNHYCSKFNIEKMENGKWKDVTNDISQVCTKQINKWEQTITNLQKGRYKFSNPEGGFRIDSEWFLEKNTLKFFFIQKDNKIFSLNKNLYDNQLIPKDINSLKVIKELKNKEKLKDVLTKEEIIKYGTNEIDISEELINKINGCEIIKWVDDKEENKLKVQGEYKDKIFKCLKEPELLGYIDNKDFNEISLIAETEPTQILKDADNYDLLMWTDDKSIKEFNITYDTEPYRPIDKLGDEFEIVKYEE